MSGTSGLGTTALGRSSTTTIFPPACARTNCERFAHIGTVNTSSIKKIRTITEVEVTGRSGATPNAIGTCTDTDTIGQTRSGSMTVTKNVTTTGIGITEAMMTEDAATRKIGIGNRTRGPTVTIGATAV